MAIEWPTVLLDEVAEDITVGYVGTMTSEYADNGVPFLRSYNVEPFRIDLTSVQHINRAFHERIRKSALVPGDVVIVRTGRPGAAAVIPSELTEANCSDLVVVRPGPRLDARFLAYYINSAAAHHVAAHLVGAVQQHFNVGSARQLRMALPPLAEQRAIAHILGTLDDKIELNRRQNETLEALARALFKSWFVDFEPVRAKAEGRSPVGMDAATAALFADRFDNSEPGPVPEGWEVRPLDSIADFQNGLALQRFAPAAGETPLPVIKIRELRTGVDASSGEASPSIRPECIIDDGDVVFSWSGSLTAVIWCGGRGALNQHLFKVTSTDYPRWFYYLWVLEHLPSFQEIAGGKATTMGHIQRHHLTEAKVLVPHRSLIAKATELFEPLLDLFVRNNVEARTLAAVRDALLPRLMSGEIRVGGCDGR